MEPKTNGLTRRSLLQIAPAALLSTAVPALARPGMTSRVHPVTSLIVRKKRRKLFLASGSRVLRRYDIDLGFNPIGDKVQEGDGRTPEGVYRINRRNPQSRFHLSLGISYPNAEDRRNARTRGVSPGGDIFIHGRGHSRTDFPADWTAGCIAVTDAEMEEIFRLVGVGVPIAIKP